MEKQFELIEALVDLQSNGSFQTVIKHLKEQLELTQNNLMTEINTVIVHQLQGEVKTLKTFLDRACSAEKELSTIKREAPEHLIRGSG